MSTSAKDLIHLLTPQEAAELVGTSAATLANDRAAGRGLPYVKISPQRIRYRLSDLLAYLDERTVRPGAKG
ncbi:helix-turn-helix domain-containing protein [Nocardia cyriacigeorgica]|nr:helix-turn-helix domain-containing protein [Nocardia cyriacigeorgica]MBF6199862.1 helix-turn-helix domain-containing protein [Nocardia cyriacigeorgica]